MPHSAEEKERIEEAQAELTELTRLFCAEHLDAEHGELAARLITKLARKRAVVPLTRGAAQLRAAAVLHALAQINYLFGRDKPVHTSPDEIATFFGVRKATVIGKAKAIRDLLKLRPFDAEFSDARTRAANPLRRGSISIGTIQPADAPEGGQE